MSAANQREDCLLIGDHQRKSWSKAVATLLWLPGIVAPAISFAAGPAVEGPSQVGVPADAADRSPPGFALSDPKTYRLKLVLRVEAQRATVRNVTATGPVPIDWPEQTVRLLSEQKPPGSKTTETRLRGCAGMLVFRVPLIRAGAAAVVERVYEITRYRIRFQIASEELTAAKQLSRELRQFLAPAPGVETRNGRIVRLAESLAKPDADAWNTARAYFDWVRGNVTYEFGRFRGAASALDKKTGDCEDMTALFVALCRISEIPARTVWIEHHAYPEFYLEDKQGQGYWIPVQISGPEWFGEMAEYRPIFQKGDRFRDPLLRRSVRYVPQTARAQGGSVRLSWTRELLGAGGEQKRPSQD